MSSDVTVRGVEGRRPGREALTGDRPQGAGPIDDTDRPERDDAYSSYYGQPIVRRPSWNEVDIVGYLFVGGLAGGSSMLAQIGGVAGSRTAAGRMRVVAAGGSVVSLGLLIHDLGRPARFLNMMRVFKPTSPMNLGSWLIGAYAPSTLVAAFGNHVGILRPLVRPASWTAAGLGAAMTAYTGVLLADTAVPAWHEGGDELPFVFAGSSAMSAGGMGMMIGPSSEAGPSRRFALAGAAIETIAEEVLHRRAGLLRPAHEDGLPGRLVRVGQALTLAGTVAALLGRGRPRLRPLGGACFVAASAVSRWAVFRAGIASADDPRFVIEPQRRRADARSDAALSSR